MVQPTFNVAGQAAIPIPAPARVLFLLGEKAWVGGERLPLICHQHGIQTGLVFPVGAPMGFIPCAWSARWAPQEWFVRGGFDAERFVSLLFSCIEQFNPDLLVLVDDLLVNVLALSRPWELERGAAHRSLFERSLGDLPTLGLRGRRASLVALASEAGVRIPETKHNAEGDGVTAFAERFDFCCIIKTEQSSGGQGVQRTTGGRDFLDRVSALTHARNSFVVQREIVGRRLMRTFIAQQGRVVAGLTLEKLRCSPEPYGPSSVVQCVENTEVREACERIAQHWGISGFASADFMVDDRGGEAYLIEFNSRPVTVMHLGDLGGVDFVQALAQLAVGVAPDQKDGVCDASPVAIFPKEWLRDRSSRFLCSGRNDIPWEVPELVRHYAGVVAAIGLHAYS